MRIALALCLIAGSTLCGKALAGSARRRAELLGELADSLRVLRIHMTSMFEPVQNALERTECTLLNLVAQGMREGMSAGEAWKNVAPRAARRGGPIDALSDRDRQVLDGLFAHLGESGREEQELLLNGAVKAIEELRETARRKVAETDRLYVTLGLLFGLMLALIVI